MDITVLNSPNHNRSFLELVSEELSPGFVSDYSIGYNSSVGTTLTDISELGVAWIPVLSTAALLEVVSSSTSDTTGGGGGIGARQVEVHGLDSNFNEIRETVSLNGTTPVATTLQYIRINDFHVIAVGSNSVAVGNITIRGTGGGTAYSRISAGGNRQLQAHYTVPNNKIGIVRSWSGYASANKDVKIFLRGTAHGSERMLIPGVFHFVDSIINAGVIDCHIRFPAKADIKISGQVIGAGTGEAIGRFAIYNKAI